MSIECEYGNGLKLGVGPLPGRKKICLYHIRGSSLDVLARFDGEEDANRFCNLVWNCTYPEGHLYSEGRGFMVLKVGNPATMRSR